MKTENLTEKEVKIMNGDPSADEPRGVIRGGSKGGRITEMVEDSSGVEPAAVKPIEAYSWGGIPLAELARRAGGEEDACVDIEAEITKLVEEACSIKS